jgi:hypothetical protein
VVGLHVTGEGASVIRDLYVHRRQAIVVPFRVPANVHVHLSGVRVVAFSMCLWRV